MLLYQRVDVLYTYCMSFGQVQRFLAALVCVAAANLEDCEIEERGAADVSLEEIEGLGWQSLEIIRLLMLLMFKILHQLKRNATDLI